MLEARDRHLLLEGLRPPDGYRFDMGVGTTYSLDLLALLMAPLAFTFFDQNRREEGAAYDSLEVLESLRRHADRLTLFCQASHISIPRAQYPQLAFVEQSVVECQPKSGGAFHPKLWVSGFVGDGPVKFRVLCLSRNLVFAQCWDTLLSLDGELEDRSRPVAASKPLAEFVESLPQHAVRPLSTELVERTTGLAAELQRTRFEPPPGFTDFTFWPIGLPGRRARLPFTSMGKRLLIVSPFLTLSRIDELAGEAKETTVVSTPQELAKLARRPAGVQRFFVLNERAQAELEPTTVGASLSIAETVQLRDLHAKLYVTETGWDAHLWTGSANATASGFDRNVEFLVELIGPKKDFGLDALLQHDKDSVRLINLLTPADDLVGEEPTDPDAEALEALVDGVRNQLALAQFEAHVHADGDTFGIILRSQGDRLLAIPDGVAVTCWPSTVAPQSCSSVNAVAGSPTAVFQKLTRQALTTFFVFEVTGKLKAATMTVQFVLNVPLIGAPEGRKEDVLRALLQDRKRLLRFLMLLLASEGAIVPELEGESGEGESHGSGRRDGFSPNGLFEMLLRALDEAPHRLDHLETLLVQLKRGTGTILLPEGFDAVWQPIMAHRRTLVARR